MQNGIQHLGHLNLIWLQKGAIVTTSEKNNKSQVFSRITTRSLIGTQPPPHHNRQISLSSPHS